ncbi:peptidase M1-like protein [Mariniflexile fucanivorans]|uniref:Peptidase M1-like protein n=1 Tax=Mariniflexile fucanivorans TaxID=264023 RepID=A0A4R1RD30_9FLAO|nr:M1 family metallopeptidase [Mariniflexile fucanivorans]TCL63402.1 peptidase M1-like protein [Mariniflexile fucanivorans]
MKQIILSIICISALWNCSTAQTAISPTSPNAISSCYWQQHVDYKMDIDMDVKTYQYKGKQTLVYTNNSPDVLNRVYYHLFFNAFQPGSEMDVRSQTIADPDSRVGDRIGKLQPNEIGYIKVNSLKQNGTTLKHETVGTVLEVTLAKPIQPGESVTFDMDFDGQVPLQIRRSGRNSSEGVALSMTQWYPKLAEYDFEGWHADPYIGREFHGVWGDFDVKITIDKNYILGGTGYLENPNDIGYGYETTALKKQKGKTLTWHFVAPKVHDFTWAADPDYIHDTMQVPNGPLLHFFYKKTLSEEYKSNWKKMQPKTVELMQYYSEHIGKYPFNQYSVIQGGDGGMEYAMCTLITGERRYGSLVGVTAHELAHTWFQFLLATNESKHEWMDEGFTSYISDLAMNEIMKEGKENPTESAYKSYIALAKSGAEQPLTTHADRYNFNGTYGASAYNKGEVFIAQLGYVIGEENLKETLKKYFNDFAFKHPTPNDIIRTAEKVSGLELDWYLTDFAQTTNTIDYAVKTIKENAITLERLGLMPMPIDLTVTYEDNTTEDFYIPLQMMRGEKPTSATLVNDWAWAYPTYTFETKKTVKSVEIDPKNLMADINTDNNKK